MAFWNGLFGKTQVLGAPVSGEAIALKAVKDRVFSEGMLGKGMAVIPDADRIVAPCSAEVSTVFETGHAVILDTDGGAQVLIHIGIDTVRLEGQHFRIMCAAGAQVKKGQPLVEFDRKKIEQAGYDATVVMVVLEGGEMQRAITGKRVEEGEEVIRLTRR